jgi:hypothetical protein
MGFYKDFHGLISTFMETVGTADDFSEVKQMLEDRNLGDRIGALSSFYDDIVQYPYQSILKKLGNPANLKGEPDVLDGAISDERAFRQTVSKVSAKNIQIGPSTHAFSTAVKRWSTPIASGDDTIFANRPYYSISI